MYFMTNVVEQIALETMNEPSKDYENRTPYQELREEILGLRGYNPPKTTPPYVNRPVNYPEPIVEDSLRDWLE